MKTTKYAFDQWANCPKTSHPKDMERFYMFCKTASKHRNKHYLNEKNFRKELFKSNDNQLSEEDIKYFYNKFKELYNYDNNRSINAYDFIGIDKKGLKQYL